MQAISRNIFRTCNSTDCNSAVAVKRIVAVIPAYNEERFIGSVVLKSLVYATNVIVVDDGSCDATAEVAASAGAHVVRHVKNQGKGAALNTGFRKACELNPDVVVTIDADGQHLASEMELVVRPVLEGSADVVIGSRYLEDTSEVPEHRVWGHWIFNLLTTTTSGVSATDSQSGYRAFSPKAVQCFDFSSNGFSVESEMQFLVGEHQLKLVEVPITIQYQDKAKRNVFHHGMMVLNGILRLTGQYRPLLFFGLPGLVTVLAGMILGVRIVQIYKQTLDLAVGYGLLSVLLFVMGMVAFSTGVILHSMRGLLIDSLRANGQKHLK